MRGFGRVERRVLELAASDLELGAEKQGGDTVCREFAQAVLLAQINAAVSWLDQMTRQNSALVDQSDHASESLRRQTHELAALLSRFVLPGQPGGETSGRYVRPRVPQLT